MQAHTVLFELECLAPKEQLDELAEMCRNVLDKAKTEAVIHKHAIDKAYINRNCENAPQVNAPMLARKGKVRLFSGCTDPNDRPFSGAFLIGLDGRVPPMWRTAAFFSTPEPSLVWSALRRLLLDPLFTGMLSADTPEDKEGGFSRVHIQIMRHQYEYGLSALNEREHGRILWIDANPTVDTIVEPYGLSILNAIARQHGFLGRIISPYIEFKNPEIHVKTVIERFQPHMIGVSLRNLDEATSVITLDGADDGIDTSAYVASAAKLISAIQSTYFGPVVLGGASLTRAARRLMGALKVKYGVQGPGDSTIDALLEKWRPEESLEPACVSFETLWDQIPGAINASNTTSKGETANVDSNVPLFINPIPRDPIKLRFERKLGIPSAVRGSYGCPLDCTYCLEATPKKHVYIRSAYDIVDEMQWMNSKYNICNFHLTDSEANMPFSRMQGLADEILRRGLGNSLTWTAYATPSPFDVSSVETLCSSGLRMIKISIDHFAQSQLLSLGKPFKEDSIHRLLEALGAAPIKPKISASILFGGPGETLSTIDHALHYIRKYSNDGVNFYYNLGIRLYPGTPLYDDWQAGRLDDGLCLGSGQTDEGISPLFYCAPAPPRVLARKIEDALSDCPNVRRIAASRHPSANASLRLLYVAATNWFKGDTAHAISILRQLGVSSRDGENIVRSALRLERNLRRNF